jgi:hypothetical protein
MTPRPELEAIVYRQYVSNFRNRNRAERDACLAAIEKFLDAAASVEAWS